MSEEIDIKKQRKENPTGWMYLMRNNGMKYTIDALLESPPNHSSTISNLSRRTGVNKKFTKNNLEILDELGVVNYNHPEYTLVEDGGLLQLFFNINSKINYKLE